MTLSATAIINGLTMLRAYDCITYVEGQGDGFGPGQEEPANDGALCVYVSKPPSEMHPDDARRLESEGWEWDETNRRWVL